MPGRIRIEVEGKQVANRHYSTVEYRDEVINKSLDKYEKIAVIISPDEQPQKRPGVDDCRRGVSNIVNRADDMGLRERA